MSSSVGVYGTRRVGLDVVLGLISDSGLRAETGGDFDGIAGSVDVFDAEGDLCFGVDSPVMVDVEDLPDTLNMRGDPVWLVVVELTSTHYQRGDAFCRSLVKAVSGAMVDEDGNVWPTKLRRKAEAKRTPAKMLSLAWWGFLHADATPLPEVLVDTAERCLGVSLVRRYGEVPPYRLAFRKNGLADLVAVWRDAMTVVEFDCTGFPFDEGYVTSPSSAAVSRGMWAISVLAVADAFTDPGARDRLRRFFAGLADASGAVYGFADVVPGFSWNGRSLGCTVGSMPSDMRRGTRGVFSGGMPQLPLDPETGIARPAIPGKGLLGLTSYPTWWSWFGGGYLPLVTESLRKAPTSWMVSQTETGVLLRLSEEPADVTQLQGPVARWLHTGWMPRRLLCFNHRPARVRLVA